MRRLAGADSQFVFQETRAQHQHTMKVVVLDPAGARVPFSYEALRRDIGRSLGLLEPLRWKLAKAPLRLGHPWWIEDPDLDIDYHVRRAAVPVPGGPVELAGVISTIASTGLERTHPLWQIWHVEGLAGGRVAYVTKLHHSLADGVSAAQLVLDAFSPSPDEDPVGAGPTRRASPRRSRHHPPGSTGR